jgi:N-acetyl-alpha-D-muramate 1-phosphate uridylyltransferase
MIPDKAFILAAGLGTRMRPLTDAVPKPMLQVEGRTLIDRILDHFEEAGVNKTVVNTHYLPDVLAAHLKQRATPEIYLSEEKKLLDTGGGIKKAIAYFDKPFIVTSGDGLWQNGLGKTTLEKLGQAWNPAIMDILILLQPVNSMKLTQGVGDYDIDDQGRVIRSKNRSGAHMFTSIRINHPRIFDNTPDGSFSYLDLLDHAQNEGRLYGLVHDGMWHHLSTPADLAAVNAAWRENA